MVSVVNVSNPFYIIFPKEQPTQTETDRSFRNGGSEKRGSRLLFAHFVPKFCAKLTKFSCIFLEGWLQRVE